MVPVNSQYLKWFKEIEKSLWAFFRTFGDLCSRCALETIDQAEKSIRDKRKSWCCCMIDDQVHDNWQQLNPIQCKMDSKWYEKIKHETENVKFRRMPGNGPCPGLGMKGCVIRQYRPITCTTQLCEKMLFMLSETGIIKKNRHAPLQIEEIVPLPDILWSLYGFHRGGKSKIEEIRETEVNTYIRTVRELKDKFNQVDPTVKQHLIDESIRIFMK